MDSGLLLATAGTTAVLGAAGYGLVQSGVLGDKVVIYDATVPETTRRVNVALRGWHRYSSGRGLDALAAIRRHPRISRLMLIGHGAPGWTFNSSWGITAGPPGPDGVSLDQFARELAPRLAPGAIIGLAGCSNARTFDEAPAGAERGLWAFSDGGQRSFAGRFRDILSRYSYVPFAEIRGHSDRGHITYNPTGRTFRIGWLHIGKPGKTVKPFYRSWQEWNNGFVGSEAERWILGL